MENEKYLLGIIARKKKMSMNEAVTLIRSYIFEMKGELVPATIHIGPGQTEKFEKAITIASSYFGQKYPESEYRSSQFNVYFSDTQSTTGF